MNSLVTFVAGVLAIVCLGQAYDFQDDDFNQQLSYEMEELFDIVDSPTVHPRVRRDQEAATVTEEKCQKRHRRPKLCCAEDTLDTLHAKKKEICRACYKEITGVEKSDRHDHGHFKRFDLFSCEQVEKRKSDMICIHQCMGQKKGLLDDNGAPIPGVLAKHLKQNFVNETWFDQTVVDKIASTCLAEAKNATENPIKFYTEGLKICNPTGITLKHCLFREIQLSCPADQIKDKASCDTFQERIKKGIEVDDLKSAADIESDISADDQ